MVKITFIQGTLMRNNSYKLNWYYEYNIQEANNMKILSKYNYTLIMFGHFKKSASILTDQDTQMVSNDQWPDTTCNAALLSFIALLHAKTWAYELNSNFKNKSGWTLYHFMNSDLKKKQAQALEVTFSRKTKSYHSQTGFNNILRIYLNEKLNFYHHIIEMLKCIYKYTKIHKKVWNTKKG